jgi:23S rRNA C2498 (ribose-2'-O)-methylase RlmM
MAQARVERAPTLSAKKKSMECGCAPHFWTFNSVEHDLCKYMLIHGIMQELTGKKNIRWQHNDPGSSRTSSRLICYKMPSDLMQVRTIHFWAFFPFKFNLCKYSLSSKVNINQPL